ncbi:MAG: NAD-dependent epimerase/dehydratase family protein [Candidatus Omnitrophica bacterium]|nr:NAD-dependent epimerase/dehydratase family protein [Candidatus Omnitrophota bacterium]
MKILVTGGAGFIGSHVAEYYAKRRWKVTVLDNLIRSKIFGYSKKSVEYNWEYLKRYSNIERILGDVRKIKDVREAIGRGVDVVIHCAAQPGVLSSVKNPRLDFAINALGTFNVLECIRRKSPKATFIYCSTNKVYGGNVCNLPIKELKTRYVYKGVRAISEEMSIDSSPHTPYGVSKYLGDLYVQEYAYIYGIRTGVFRMSCIYGVRQFGFEDQGWIAHFIITALKEEPITIYGNGKQVRDVLYVKDLVKAFDLFLRSKIKHSVYNIGGGPENTTSLLEFFNLLSKKLDRKPKIRYSNWRPFDQKVYISDISKIKRDLGWEATISFERGIDKLLSWAKKFLSSTSYTIE